MADVLPWFPFYPLDWINSPRVLALDPAERDAYQMLLCLQWRDNGLPADVNGLWPLLPANVKRAAAAKMLEEFFDIDAADGKRRNLKLLKLRDEAVKKLNTNRRRGQLGAKARYGRTTAPTTEQAVVEAGSKHSESQSESETTSTTTADGLPPEVAEAVEPYLRSARYPEAVRSTVALLLHPEHSPHYDAKLIAQALREMQAASRSFNSSVLSAWCQRLTVSPASVGSTREGRMVENLQRFVKDGHAA